MNTRIHRRHARPGHLTALLVFVGSLCLSPLPASAQGSLIVTVTSPTSGSTVGGTITVSASTSGLGILVAGVQFTLDGVNLGAEDTAAPYAIPWNTITASNGSHTLRAVARDSVGLRFTSDPVTVTVFNDIIAPTVTMTAPAAGVTVSDMSTVSASASDNVGVVGVQFILDGANLGAEDTTAPYSVSWDTTTANNGPHVLAAIARDAVGNRGTAASVAVTVRNAATRFENTDLSITYTGSAVWWHGSRSREWSATTASFNRAEGARATFAFIGRSVSWIGFRAPWAGVARVLLDGAFVTQIDLYATTEQVQTTVFKATGLALGPHTLVVEVTGTRNPAAADNAVVVDAFDVGPSSPLPVLGARLEETSSSTTYVGSWTQGDRSLAWSGGTAASGTVGAEATVTFKGTSVSWIGLRGPQTGIAEVYLDGAFQATVDTSSPDEVQAVVFSATGLVPGQHTLRVVAATAEAVVVDAFDVRSRVEETDASIQYSGAWVREHTDRAWSGTSANTGTGTASLSYGGQARFTFTGTQVTWIGFRGPQTGLTRVYVDDVLIGDVNTQAPTEQVQVPLFTASGLADGSHSITIESIGSLTVVDAFDVTLPAVVPTVTRLQETDSAIAYTAGWSLGSGLTLWSGQAVNYSSTPGVAATLTFDGTGVRWIGQRGFQSGVANVYLDGVLVAQIDTTTSVQEEFQAVLFSATGLTAGIHTLRIESTAGNDRLIVVDAFDISR